MAREKRKASVDPKLLDLLACPLTKGPLKFDPEKNELSSNDADLAYPIRDGIAVMLPSEARALDEPDEPGNNK
ncbi:MAG: Trm112 family protein [Rhizobiaceae bacterium]